MKNAVRRVVVAMVVGTGCMAALHVDSRVHAATGVLVRSSMQVTADGASGAPYGPLKVTADGASGAPYGPLKVTADGASGAPYGPLHVVTSHASRKVAKHLAH